MTHNGIFHPDDVFAVATALLVFPGSEVIRSRDPEVIELADVVIDVGMEYDPERYRFDHHQDGTVELRTNGVPYAAFGLVWREFGYRLAKQGAGIIEEKLVIPIDAPDNNFSLFETTFDNLNPYTIRDYFYSYLPYGHRTEHTLDRVFMQVVRIAKRLIEREITKAEERAQGIIEVEQIVEKTSDRRIVVLSRDLPWEPVLVPRRDVLFVIYPRREGNWAAKSIPKHFQSIERKKLFPYAWAGKSQTELERVSGVEGARFCHLGRFIATADSCEAAVRLAERALNA